MDDRLVSAQTATTAITFALLNNICGRKLVCRLEVSSMIACAIYKESDEGRSASLISAPGLIFALILNAAIQYQTGTAHPDPTYATCFFMKATAKSRRTEFHVRPIRPSNGLGRFTYLSVDVIQEVC